MKKLFVVLVILCLTGTMVCAQSGGKPPALPPDGKPGAGGPPPEGLPPEGLPPDGMPPEGFGTIPDAQKPELSAAMIVDGETVALTNAGYEASEKDTGVLLARNGGTVSVTGGT